MSAIRYGVKGILLRWNPIENGKAIHILRTNLFTEETEELAVIQEQTTEYLDEAAFYDTPYKYELKIELLDGSIRWSVAEKYQWVQKSIMIHGEGQNDGIAVQWKAVEGADGYTLRRKIGMKGEDIVVKVIDDGNLTCWLDTEVKNTVNQPVYYRVQTYCVYEGIRYYGGYSDWIEVSY